MMVRDIIKNYLLENGFDGLVCPGECGCQMSDMAPCGCDSVLKCEPAYKGACGEEDGYDFYMYTSKAAAQKSLEKGQL